MWWWESVGWGSRTECGTRAHVGGDQDSFLGLAVMQVCGDQVLPGARNDGDWVVILPDALTTMMEQSCGGQLIPRAHNSWGLHILCHRDSAVMQIWGDPVAPAHRQWSKLVETEPGNQVVK